MRRPERGPDPMARTLIDLNSDVDILQRRIGDQTDSATTVGELVKTGVVATAGDGSLKSGSARPIGGPQGLYNFLKRR